VPIPVRTLALAGALVLLCACQSSPRTVDVAASVPRRGTPCEELAHSFYVVAVRRDRGESRKEQVEAAEASAQSPFVRDADGSVGALKRVIGFVYRNPDASPAEIRSQVTEHCTTNERGQVVLGRPWQALPADGTHLTYDDGAE
jgi:hypothetical protein